jgi:hypothetical protein
VSLHCERLTIDVDTAGEGVRACLTFSISTDWDWKDGRFSTVMSLEDSNDF